MAVSFGYFAYNCLAAGRTGFSFWLVPIFERTKFITVQQSRKIKRLRHLEIQGPSTETNPILSSSCKGICYCWHAEVALALRHLRSLPP